MLFTDAIEMVWTRHYSLLPSASSHRASLNHLKRLIPDTPDHALQCHETADYHFKRYARRRLGENYKGKPIKKSTINREIAHGIKTFNLLREYKRRGELANVQLPEDNPASLVKKFSEREYIRKRYIPPEEFKIILEESTPRLRKVLEFAIHSGRRRKEIFTASKENIDTRNNILHGMQTKTDVPFRTKLNRRLMDIIQESSSVLIFQRDKVNFRKEFEAMRTRVMKRGLAYFQMRDLRRSAAVNAYEICRDIKAVQEFLGHTKVSTTEVYLNLPSNRLTDIANGLDKMYEAVS